jgi:signal peptidase II
MFQKKRFNKKNIVLIFITIFFLLDRYLKYLALDKNIKKEIIPKILNFSLSKNYNISFSLKIFDNPQYLIYFIGLIIFFLILYLLYLKKNNYSRNITLSLFLIISGAVSNLIDRINYYFVIDYLNFLNINILNIADIMISLGAISLIYFSYIKKKS